MPRRARTASGTGIYHIMMRGVNRRNIFDDDEDRQRFVQILDGLPFQYDEQGTLLPIRTCSLYAWCLMTNHFHLLIRERDWKISEVIKSLASSYVFYYNKKNERIGHLFQERFKSEPCNDMEYFVTLLRYIHQNPVKAGIADNAADYEWSSWKQDYLRGEDEGWPICHVKTVLKRIPLEELKALVDEPCYASCIDVDNTRRLKDEEVRELIAQQSGAATEDAFQELEREQQENIIVWLRDEGASVRQIVRHTGFTTKQVRNLTDKDKKKQAD